MLRLWDSVRGKELALEIKADMPVTAVAFG
jgi:hypothetical protein